MPPQFDSIVQSPAIWFAKLPYNCHRYIIKHLIILALGAVLWDD